MVSAQPSKNKPRKTHQFSCSFMDMEPLLRCLYSEKHWNVISPVDNSGYAGRARGGRAKMGNLDTSNLLGRCCIKIQTITWIVSDAILCIYGSSMGGYGAITNGCILGAKAVYANVPQIKLLGSTYSEFWNEEIF